MSKLEDFKTVAIASLPLVGLLIAIVICIFGITDCARRQMELNFAMERECIRVHGTYHNGVCIQAVSR